MAKLFHLPRAVVINDAGRPYAGALANFYLTGTTTRADTYADAALTTAHLNPVPADSARLFPAIYLDPQVEYKLVLTQSNGTQIYTVDPVSEETFTQDDLGLLLYPRTQAESDASVTPTYYQYPPGNLLRYGAVSGGVVATNSTAWQSACAQAASNSLGAAPVYIPRSANGYEIDAGATITAYPVRIYGDNAYNSFLTTSADISILTLTDVQQVNGPILENIGFLRGTSSGSTKALLQVNNSSNGRIQGCQILRGKYGVYFAATATAPNSCYGWAIRDSIIANCGTINIECEAQTNSLTLENVVIGAGAPVGLHIVDSIGFSCVGSNNLEGATSRGIDIDATTDLAMGAYISGFDFETCVCTLGVIRIGATALVRGVKIESNQFNNAGSSEWAVNPIRCYDLTMVNNVTTTGFNSGEAVNRSGTDQAYFSEIGNTWQTNSAFFSKGSLVAEQYVNTRVAVTYSASMTPNAALGNHQDIVITDSSAFTVNAPTNPLDGQLLTLTFINTSGGAHGTGTMNAVFHMAGGGTSIPTIATGTNRSLTFRYRINAWLEVSRNANDVPN